MISSPYKMQIRRDLLGVGVSVPVGDGYSDQATPFWTRWINGDQLGDNDFQVWHKGQWRTAQSIDFEDIENNMSETQYPFNDGDIYFAVDEDGKLVESVWDDISEEMYDENPDRLLFGEDDFEWMGKPRLQPYSG